MAAVSIPPSPHAIGTMASRRAPLSNLPNAGNSPYRVSAVPAKQSRSQSVAAADLSYAQPPPFKKKIIEAEESAPTTPKKKNGQALLDTIASRNERVGATRNTRQLQKPDENLETLRQWQNHYRKVFPTFVFYFESIADEARRQCSRGITALGAKQEKFFSKDVTHVITSRSVPTEAEHSPIEVPGHSSLSGDGMQSRTINPSLLEKRVDDPVNVPKGKFTFEQPTSKKFSGLGQEADSKKQALGNVDILLKSKEMGMKIWQVEKLQRILNVILEDQTFPVETSSRTQNQRAIQDSRPKRQLGLSQLIKNEQMNGPTEREANLINFDIIPFKGPHIYIRDMNEKTKPMMVREYQRVASREDGEWPQFRSVSAGKCPFVEEDSHSRRLAEKNQAREEARQKKALDLGAPRTRSNVAAHMDPPPFAGRKRPLAEIDNNTSVSVPAPQKLPEHVTHEEGFSKPTTHTTFPSRPGGEPMASGLQASNITSAIRSQMISSTAAAPGAKAGTSKEIHGLQRKVLERNNSGSAVPTLVTSRRMPDIAAAARGSTRAAKQKAQERLGLAQIHEDEQSTEGLDTKQPPTQTASHKVLRKEKREPKPGYCENCREKFEDFDEHTMGKRHRKFATTKDNWKELDGLLSVLGRPFRDDTHDMNH